MQSMSGAGQTLQRLLEGERVFRRWQVEIEEYLTCYTKHMRHITVHRFIFGRSSYFGLFGCNHCVILISKSAPDHIAGAVALLRRVNKITIKIHLPVMLQRCPGSPSDAYKQIHPGTDAFRHDSHNAILQNAN